MKRRDVLKLTALATGSAVCAPVAGSLLSACTSPPPDQAVGELFFFTTEEFSMLEMYVDTLLPKTESPSASELNIHQVIDHMVGNVYFDEERKTYRLGFDALKKLLKEEGFTDLEQEARVKILSGLENTQDNLAGNAHRHIKQQTVAYYLSTEEIAKNYLNYLPVPGEYQGCISLEEAGGKAWAL